MPDAIPTPPQGGDASLPKKKWAYVPIRAGNRVIFRRMRVNINWRPGNVVVVHHDNHDPLASSAPATSDAPLPPEGEGMIKAMRLIDGYGRPVKLMLKASPHHTRWDPIEADPFGGYLASSNGCWSFFWPDPIQARRAAAYYNQRADQIDRDDAQKTAAGIPTRSGGYFDARRMADAARDCVAIHGLIAGASAISGEPMAKAAPDEVIWEGSIQGAPARLARWRSTLVGTVTMPGRLPFHMILHPDHDEAKKQLRAAVADLKAGKTPREGVFRREEIAA